MSVLILVLAMNMVNSQPTSVSIELNVNEQKCEEIYIPMVKKKYVSTSMHVVSAQCLPN